MRTLVFTALLVSALGSPVPDDDDCDHRIIHYSGGSSGSQHAVSYSAVPVVQHWTASYSSKAPRPVQPAADVEKATAEFMAAWNKAAARATKIQTVMYKSAPTGAYTIQMPTQVQQTEEVRRATAEFMEAWNAAARRATVVEHAAFTLPQPVQPTAEVRKATAQFMSAWESAARQASALQVAVTKSAPATHSYSGPPRPVQPTEEVRQATAQFMAAWREAASRVPSIQPTIYKVAGAVPSSETPRIVGGVPQVTFEVERATSEFMKVWRAAAAAAEAAPDVHMITGTHYQPRPAAHAAVAYSAPSGPVQPTADVQKATAEFMAAWNAAAQRASKIQATMYKAGSHFQAPRQVGDTDAVKRATAEFMAAWNAAARRGSVVEQVISTIPVQVDHTAEVKKATAEFMASWQAAAKRASTIQHAVSTPVTYSARRPVQETADVEKATAEFMALWNEAAARVPKIETTLYAISGTGSTSQGAAPVPVTDTAEVKAARAAFMAKFRAAQAAAVRTSVTRGVLPVPTVIPAHHIMYSSTPQFTTYKLDDRIFAPYVGLPIYASECKDD